MITIITVYAAPDGGDAGSLADALRGPVAERLAGTGAGLGARRVVVSTRIPDAIIDSFASDRGWREAPDAMLQVTFDDDARATAALRDPAGPWADAALGGVADPRRTATFAARELEVFGGMEPAERWSATGTPVKLVVGNAKRPDIPVEAFTFHWAGRHGPMVSRIGPTMGYRTYVQSHRVVDAGVVAAADAVSPLASPDGGLTEVWFTDQPSMDAGMTGEAAIAGSDEMKHDEEQFVHPPSMWAFVAVEQLVLDAG